MTSDRSYSVSMTHSGACEELERCAGTQFDARVVKALLGLLESEAASAETALALI
jgi:HD-GYP domain-containing protein (c-di-GMP phosphodiesterase class II)